MLWKLSGGIGLPSVGAGTADLRCILNLPGHLQFPEAATTNQMAQTPCTVRKVSRSELVVELSRPSQMPQPGNAVVLEVAQHTAMIQCYTSVKSRGPGMMLTLHTPGSPHVVQRRRFPRVDLFVGITVRNLLTPGEELAAQMINLSLDGAACVLVEPQAPGRQLIMNLSAVGLYPAEAEAMVMRCTPAPSHLWVVGVKFVGITPEQDLYLGKYISQCTDQQSV